MSSEMISLLIPLIVIIPLALLIMTTFFLFWYTGKGKGSGFINAIMNAEFEKSILMSGIITLVITSVFYVIQKIPMKEIESHFLIGGNDLIPPIIILILSWGLSSIVEDLGFVNFATNILGPKIPAFLIPAVNFLIGCVASYFMGSAWGTWALIIYLEVGFLYSSNTSAWGTWALIMPIAVPLAISAKVDLPLVIGAVLAGGSLGYNASPLGETAILSGTVAEVPLMEYIKSQLPYSLAAVVISFVLFIVLGVMF